jgi:hypothetical protein
MMFIHLIIILINSLSMPIIIVEHLFMWFIHVLGGGKAILLLLQQKFCIRSYIMYLRSWPFWYIILDAASYLVGYAGRRHIALHSYAFKVLLEEICHHCFYWKFIHYALIYSWFNTKAQFYVKSLFNWTCG